MHLILASASPRRKEILNQLGISYSAVASDFDESAVSLSNPKDLAIKLAESKALDISQKYPQSFVLGYDTIVDNGEALGKPRNSQHAFQLLSALSNREHKVHSGVCLCKNGEILQSAVESTTVIFRQLSEKEINDYIETQECNDKAGAYAIQGMGARFVKSVHGCYYNVVGLPVSLTLNLLEPYLER